MMKNKLSEPKIESAFALLVHLFRRIACFGAVVVICSSAPAQNLFGLGSGVGDGGKIFELNPAGVPNNTIQDSRHLCESNNS